MSSSPTTALIQKTVDLSSSRRSRRWISALMSALSVNTTTNEETISTIAARPQSCGASNRASTRATTMRDACSMIWDPAFQARPLRIREPRASGLT
jgi:hypothetical protein